jgi:methylamine---glutamate N-methyltransferase subunit A
MCGIVGFLDKTHNRQAPVGLTIFNMLQALGCRGPDSAGVALYSQQHDGDLVLRVKLGEQGDFAARSKHIAERLQAAGCTLGEVSTTAAYLRLVIETPPGDLRQLECLIESAAADVEVVSMGHQLEIVKQVGSPQNLDATYCIKRVTGTHGIGHTRLSTESRVDLSHSQPFWAHGAPDLATVHNGHITNYDKMRRQYAQRGVRFYTHNDSEIIGVYLAERLAHGLTLEEAMRASLVDFDGSFSYLAATADAVGFAKDPFALKPLLVAETETFVALATEEIAMRAALAEDGQGRPYGVREAQAKEVRVWQR